jgi:hypothetical protein
MGVKGGAVASQLCRRKRLIHWIRGTALSAFFVPTPKLFDSNVTVARRAKRLYQ